MYEVGDKILSFNRASLMTDGVNTMWSVGCAGKEVCED